MSQHISTPMPDPDGRCLAVIPLHLSIICPNHLSVPRKHDKNLGNMRNVHKKRGKYI
jgi:hypothetical protein